MAKQNPRQYESTPGKNQYDAIVIGSGPNGLAAAIEIARAGRSVLVVEARETIGGGMRTKSLGTPGFHHDICSAVHPMAMASPFFKTVPLADYGLEWVNAELPMAHPLDGGEAFMAQSIDQTADQFQSRDADAYRRLFKPLVRDGEKLMVDLLAPFKIPAHPFAVANFGLNAMRPAKSFAKGKFKSDAARALFAGNAAHSIQPLENMFTSAISIMLMVAGHMVNWPLPKGGSQSIANAMAAYLESLGGEIICNYDVKNLTDLPKAEVHLLDTSPRALVDIAGEKLTEDYRRKVAKYRHGPGVFKIDWQLNAPIPWKGDACRRACTIHVGGTLDEIAAAERDCWKGKHADKPFVLVVQPSVFDETRAPGGKHTGWAYCHVPPGSTEDQTAAIESQIERFAPGFRDCIDQRHTMNCADFERYNPNYVGGDIICGVQDWRQMFTRPVIQLNPYQTPNPDIFICSSATPPGGGVHGMCGYWAAKSALKRLS
jgi:phytoene dehydrogenase-like protein